MAKPELPPLRSQRVSLRLATADDLPTTLTWRNQPEVRRWFFHSSVIEPDQHVIWFEKYLQRDNDLLLIIEEIELLNRPVGQVSLYDIDYSMQRAEFGRLLIGDLAARGLGLADVATAMVLRIAKEILLLEEIYLSVYANNDAAVRIYEKNGFTVQSSEHGILHMSVSLKSALSESCIRP